MVCMFSVLTVFLLDTQKLQIFGSAVIESQPKWLYDPFKLSSQTTEAVAAGAILDSDHGAKFERLF